MTNRVKFMMDLQSMTDEELARLISKGLNCVECPAIKFCQSSNLLHCKRIFQVWLKQEAKK